MTEQSRTARINLIGWDNGRGLGHDLRLLRETLEALGHQVRVTSVGPRRRRRLAAMRLRAWLWWQWLRGGRNGSYKFDLNIMLEHVRPAYLGSAHCNAFIPNPEWLSGRDERHLHRFDALLTKTRVATDTFRQRGLTTHYVGFRGTDCRRAGVPRQPRFLHLAGASRMKGTQRLLALWRRHPEWPHLLVLQSPSTAAPTADRPAPANLEHRIATLADVEEIRALQNGHAFHLCLSETEGWGHYIVEAMSCGAVVITCDAPPMNELVRPDRGMLVAASATEPLHAAMRHQFDEAALEAAVAHAAALDPAQCQALGRAARDWFECNERDFSRQLQTALQHLLQNAPR